MRLAPRVLWERKGDKMHKQLSLLVIGLAVAYILSGCMGIITYTTQIVSGISNRLKRLFTRLSAQ